MVKPKELVGVDKNWSEGEIIYPCSQWAKGTSVLKIAEEMERTPEIITQKVKKIDLPPRVPAGFGLPQLTDNGRKIADALKKL